LNIWFNLTFSLSRFVQLATLVFAQIAPSPVGSKMQLNQMLDVNKRTTIW